MNTSRRPYIFDAFPGLASAGFPWTPLGRFPTPVERMDALCEELCRDELYVKRDDLSGEVYGGNKVRKLEFSLADAARRGMNPVITMGALGSNHVLATTVYARRVGLDTVGIFLPQPAHQYLRDNILCNLARGCRIEYVESEAAMFARLIRLYLTEWAKNGCRPCFLLPGGSSALGVAGYVEAAFEIADQVRAGEMPEPGYIFVPVGSTGTLAGLVLGVKLAGLKSVPVGVRVYDRGSANERMTAFMANRALRVMREYDPSIPRARVSAREIVMLHDYFGPGYGHFTRAGQEAMDLIEKIEGLKLEGTYSGKAMAGFIDYMKAPERRGRPALFVNTYNSRALDPLMDGCPGEEALPDKVREYFHCELAGVCDPHDGEGM